MVRIRTGQIPMGRNTVEDILTTVLLLLLTGGGRRRIGVSFAVAAVVGDGEKTDRIEIVKENHAVFLQKEGERQTMIVVRLETERNNRCRYGDQCDFSHDPIYS